MEKDEIFLSLTLENMISCVGRYGKKRNGFYIKEKERVEWETKRWQEQSGGMGWYC